MLHKLSLLFTCLFVSFATKHEETLHTTKANHWKDQILNATWLNTTHLDRTDEPIPFPLSAANVSQMSTDFGYNLYRKIANKHDDNIFFSPFSVTYSLASLMLGAQGTTYDQLLQGLNFNQFNKQEYPHLLPELLKEIKTKMTANKEIVLNIGSFAFLHELFSIKEDFFNLTKKYFDMEYQVIDFHSSKATDYINFYVEKLANGLISHFNDIDPQTKLLLLDTILFKGKWLYPFNPALTEIETFFVDEYNSVMVPMMYKKDKVASVSDNDLSCTVFRLPYRGNAHMLIVLPEKEGDLGILEDNLSKELVDLWESKMTFRKTDIFFPKFKLDQKYKLKSSLNELGIKEIFTGKANLTDLTEERNLLLTEVTQQAVIEIDEKGTSAVSVTVSEITPYSLPLTIRVNHPFIFMIYEETYQSLLFIGRVNNPTKF